MTLKSDAIFQEKSTDGLKNDIRNLIKFHASLRICTLMGSFCPKHIKFYLKKYKRSMSHDTE